MTAYLTSKQKKHKNKPNDLLPLFALHSNSTKFLFPEVTKSGHKMKLFSWKIEEILICLEVDFIPLVFLVHNKNMLCFLWMSKRSAVGFGVSSPLRAALIASHCGTTSPRAPYAYSTKPSNAFTDPWYVPIYHQTNITHIIKNVHQKAQKLYRDVEKYLWIAHVEKVDSASWV